jgi:pyrimidine-nucleoside phosphorylase
LRSEFNPTEIIRKKRDGHTLSKKEITFLVSEYARGKIPHYQLSAFLMAVYFQSMNFHETTYLTQAMIYSGKVLDLSDIEKPRIDKHSTGGIGDKTSLILTPLMASCGICVPMISGRGLGHTGGTLDKLESIPGFRTKLSFRELKKQLKHIGAAMIGQTKEITPADKKIYALRDVTATVDSIPLIAASIMSKKLSEDLDGLVLDVKFGSGAFMKDYKKAKVLAQTIIQIGKCSGIKIRSLLTDMNNPLGTYVGNSLEVIEVIEALKGKGPDDLMTITYALGVAALKLAKIKGGMKLLKNKIANGEALNKFKRMISYQGGDSRVTEDYSHLPRAKNQFNVKARKSGFIHNINNFKLGMLLVELGGGRMKIEDKIDPSCGFKVYKKIGDSVKKGECLVEVVSNRKEIARSVAKQIQSIFLIKKDPCPHKKLIRKSI